MAEWDERREEKQHAKDVEFDRMGWRGGKWKRREMQRKTERMRKQANCRQLWKAVDSRVDGGKKVKRVGDVKLDPADSLGKKVRQERSRGGSVATRQF